MKLLSIRKSDPLFFCTLHCNDHISGTDRTDNVICSYTILTCSKVSPTYLFFCRLAQATLLLCKKPVKSDSLRERKLAIQPFVSHLKSCWCRLWSCCDGIRAGRCSLIERSLRYCCSVHCSQSLLKQSVTVRQTAPGFRILQIINEMCLSDWRAPPGPVLSNTAPPPQDVRHGDEHLFSQHF